MANTDPNRTERNAEARPIDRLRLDMREDGYFARGVLAGKPAHTNEHIQADCIAALLELDADLKQIKGYFSQMLAQRDKQIADLAHRLERAEERIKRFIIANA